MSLTVTELDDILAGMIAAGLSHMSYSDGRSSISMRIDPSAAVPSGEAPAPPVAGSETISTVSMGRLAFAHPARSQDVVPEGATVGSGQAVAYVISGETITAVVAHEPGTLGKRLREEGEIVGYGTAVFEFNAHG